jgi:hypothetical protein
MANNDIKVKLVLDDKTYTLGIEDAKKKLREYGKETEDAGKKAAGGWREFFKGALAAEAASKALGLISAGFKKIVRDASQAEETAQKFGVVFSDVTDRASEAVKNLQDNYAYSKQGAQNMLSSTGALLTGLGLTQEKALELSEAAAQLGSDIASFSNFSEGAEGATQRLTKAMLGEYENLKALDKAISETEMKQFAADQGLVWSQMDRGARATLVLQAVMGQSKNDMGDMNRSSQSFANTMRAVNSRIDDISAGLGAELLPSLSKLGGAFLTATKDGGPLLTLFSGMVKVVSTLIEGLANVIDLLNVAVQEQKDQYYKVGIKGILDQQREFRKAHGERKNWTAAEAAEYRKLQEAEIALREGQVGANKSAAESYKRLAPLTEAELKKAKQEADERERLRKAEFDANNKRGKGGTAGGTGKPIDMEKAQQSLVKYYQYIGETQAAQVEQTKLDFQEQIKAQQELLNQKLISVEEYEARKAEIEETYRNQKEKAESTTNSVIIAMQSQTYQGATNLVGEMGSLMSSKNKRLFEFGKKMAILNVGISYAEAVMKAFSINPILGGATTVGLGLVKAEQIRTINSQKPPEFAQGVFDVPRDIYGATVHRGETIIPKSYTDSLKAGELTMGQAQPTININVNGSLIDKDGFMNSVGDALGKIQQQTGRRILNGGIYG